MSKVSRYLNAIQAAKGAVPEFRVEGATKAMITPEGYLAFYGGPLTVNHALDLAAWILEVFKEE